MPQSPQIITPKKKPGAPIGNKNAFRHGFYAKNLGLAPPKKLAEHEMRNLLADMDAATSRANRHSRDA